jgi:ADP-ribosylglycohydrolase
MTQTQLPLFGDEANALSDSPAQSVAQQEAPLDRFQGAIAFSAIGDALGWPTEFGRYPPSTPRRSGPFRLTNFVGWEKRIGGRWWGYRETIRPGSYSDDTQLALCIARCIDERGEFNPEKFAYFELPLWLVYEQGGGRSIKLAARTLVSNKREWWHNFYRRKSGNTYIDYRNAGANGAAMRVLPIALVNAYDENKLFCDAFVNAVVTHGHPRAILGTLLYAGLVAFLVQKQSSDHNEILEFLEHILDSSTVPLRQLSILETWLREWNKKPLDGKLFQDLFQNTRTEARKYLHAIPSALSKDAREYYVFTGAHGEPFKGSGLSTVLVAIYLFLKYQNEPETALLTAVNTLGSDTDTIANFVGGLFGSYHGLDAVPKRLLEGMQDREYLLSVAAKLHRVVTGEALSHRVPAVSFNRKDAMLRVLAWEIGLHEMFWDLLSEGNRLVHPSLGPGTIRRKEVRPIPREGYEAKLIEVAFDCGQTCTFHSRVAKDGRVRESLASELKRGLAGNLTGFCDSK